MMPGTSPHSKRKRNKQLQKKRKNDMKKYLIFIKKIIAKFNYFKNFLKNLSYLTIIIF